MDEGSSAAGLRPSECPRQTFRASGKLLSLSIGILIMRRFTRFWLVGVTLGLLALLVLMSSPRILPVSAQAKQAPKDSEQKKAGAPARVATYKVVSVQMPATILITGELKPARSREINVPNIRSGFASTVTFLVLEGTQVKQGDRLLEFDASTLLNNEAEAQRQLDDSKLRIEKTKVDLDVQRTDLVSAVEQATGNIKVADLYAKIPKELLASNDYLKYQVNLEKAKLVLQKAQEQLKNFEANAPAQMSLQEINRSQRELELQKIENDIGLLSVDAPQDGIVIYGDNWASNRKVQVGDTLFPGQNAITLPDLSSLQVVGYVYDTELRSLSVGMVCDIGLDAVPGRTWHGRIASLSSVAGRKGFASQHKVFKAVVQPDSVDLSVMRPGMTARLEVLVSLGSGVLAIPREYLAMANDGQYYVLKGRDPKTAVAQNVQVGVFNERQVRILSGLNEGDEVMLPSATGGSK